MFCERCGSIYKQITNHNSFILECGHCKSKKDLTSEDIIIYTEDKKEVNKSNKILFDESYDRCNTVVEYKCRYDKCTSLYSRLVNENTYVIMVCMICGNNVIQNPY